MAQTIKLKRSSVASNIPTTGQLSLGELGVNTNDGKLFIKKDDGGESIVEIGGDKALGDLSDVVIGGSPLTTGQVLTYDGANWINEDATGGGVSDHTLLTNIGTNTHAEIDTHLADDTKHQLINDAAGSPLLTTELWSASKIDSELTSKVSIAGDTMTGILTAPEVIVTGTQGFQWESGRSRISHNDGGGNSLIRFGHKFDVSEVFTAAASGAARIRADIDTVQSALLFDVASNATVADGDTVTWGTQLKLDYNALTYGASNIVTESSGTTLYLGLTATAADSSKLNGVASADTNIVSTIVKRDSSGDIDCRLLRMEYTPLNTSPNYFLTQVAVGTGDNYSRPATLAQVRTSLGTMNSTDALDSATTTVNVSSATAPSSGQVLTATSSTAATWQAPGTGFVDLTTAQTIAGLKTFSDSVRMNDDLTFNNNLQIMNSSGSLASPSYSFQGDSNTGMTQNGSTENIHLVTSGVSRLQIESNGTLNVSGTTNYENLVTADDDVPNKKYVDDLHAQSGSKVLIQSLTASTSASLDFTTGIDNSTYEYYVIEFTDIVPTTTSSTFYLRVSEDGGSTWAATAGDYRTGTTNLSGIALCTTNVLTNTTGTTGACGDVKIYNAGSTTAFKRFLAVSSFSSTAIGDTDAVIGMRYDKTLNAINAFQILMFSGNILRGTAKLYGIVA